MNLPELRDVCWLDKKFRQGRFSLPLKQILNFPTSLICRFPSCATPQPPKQTRFYISFIDYCIWDVLVYLMHPKSAEQNSQFLDSGKTIRHISLRWRYNAMTSFYRLSVIHFGTKVIMARSWYISKGSARINNSGIRRRATSSVCVPRPALTFCPIHPWRGKLWQLPTKP